MIDEKEFLISESDTKTAKRLGVSPSTVGRWKKDIEKAPYWAVKKMAHANSYRIRFERIQRSYEY